MISLSALYLRQRGLCIYCEQVATLSLPAYVLKREGIALPEMPAPGTPRSRKLRRYRRATREHIVRKVDGGSDDPENLVMACEFCNSFRGTADPADHKIAMMRLVEAGEHPLVYGRLRTGGEQRRSIKLVLLGCSAQAVPA